ncbi:myelin basic protein-like [Platichthys flesus]|uniref:myelin basic protein-like n=1 Tax=Platichthys flesus TaxID=8260 RepID=UPI001A8A66D3|nr:myelin basic protein-like [Platichthys flesus]
MTQPEKVSVTSMGQHLGKKESPTDSMASSPEPNAAPTAAAAPVAAVAEPESQDEVFGLGEADAYQNNGSISTKPAVTDSTGAEGPLQSWTPADTADPDTATPRPHLARLFSRDAPGREDNTFKERPSESDELQTIQEHSGAASECGSDNPEQDLD